jgi:hypothetical protein
MTYTVQLAKTFDAVTVDAEVIAGAINALTDCADTCTLDVDADLGVPNVSEMIKCIRLCQHCADICTTTARILSRPAEYDARVTVPLLKACLAVCQVCGDECEEHAERHQHCRVCAQACRSCETVCRELLATL